MLVNYCDLCGQPIKERKYSLTIWAYNLETKQYKDSLGYDDNPPPSKFNKDIEKEICETCCNVINQIFAKRMEKLLNLSEDLKTIYEQPTKEPKHEKNKKKKKED